MENLALERAVATIEESIRMARLCGEIMDRKADKSEIIEEKTLRDLGKEYFSGKVAGLEQCLSLIKSQG